MIVMPSWMSRTVVATVMPWRYGKVSYSAPLSSGENETQASRLARPSNPWRRPLIPAPWSARRDQVLAALNVGDTDIPRFDVGTIPYRHHSNPPAK
jgi:hypothetical protein